MGKRKFREEREGGTHARSTRYLSSSESEELVLITEWTGPLQIYLLNRLVWISSCSSSGIERSPFSRNMDGITSVSFSSSTNMSIPVRQMRGPIFTDGPHFDIAFRLFHGRESVVPLSGPSLLHLDNPKPDISQQFNPLAAKAATISLSGFCSSGPFGFNSFSRNWKNK